MFLVQVKYLEGLLSTGTIFTFFDWNDNHALSKSPTSFSLTSICLKLLIDID